MEIELIDRISARPGRVRSRSEFHIEEYLLKLNRRYKNAQLLNEEAEPLTVGEYSAQVLKKPYIVKPQ